LFFAYLINGFVKHISFDGAGNVQSVGDFTTATSYVVQMTEGPDGILYYVDLNDGKIGRWEAT
jgi:hypothetical protein